MTVNFNMADEIAATLESVLGQDYPHFESIVIDGGSSDGSRAIIESFAVRLSYWKSERDRNLYDAMNKGVAAATGEWIVFMNSGDRFAAANVLSCMFAQNHDDVDMLYGHHIRHYPVQCIDRLIRAETPEILPYRMHCSHQSLFMRRQLLVEHPFRTDILAADYESVLFAYTSGKRFGLVNCVVAVTAMGGRSDAQRLRSLKDRIGLVRSHGLMTTGLAFFYAGRLVWTIVAQPLKKLIPKALLAYILRHRTIGGLG